MSLHATTWQTVGPFFRIGLAHLNGAELAPLGTAGERVTIEGTLLDGNGVPVPDAVVEIWQANADGLYNVAAETALNPRVPVFTGFGRLPTDASGHFRFSTVRPGPVPGPGGGLQAPHLTVRLMMRGLLRDLVTRMYFPDEMTASDPILQSVPEHRRGTLTAARLSGHVGSFVWNIELQGERETVFFDC
jgi:protocatechuate 3,4-dioxygenase, alpha subunit